MTGLNKAPFFFIISHSPSSSKTHLLLHFIINNAFPFFSHRFKIFYYIVTQTIKL